MFSLSMFSAQSGPIEPAENEAPNTCFEGTTGSKQGADFVPPTGYFRDGFDTIGDVIARHFPGHNGVQFVAPVVGRGYLLVTWDATAYVGQTVNASIAVDEVLVTTVQRAIHLTGDATQTGANATVPPVGTKNVRIGCDYTVTGPSIQVRIGLGTTADTTGDFTLSRPQLSVGSGMSSYNPSCVLDNVVTFNAETVTFNGETVTYTEV